MIAFGKGFSPELCAEAGVKGGAALLFNANQAARHRQETPQTLLCNCELPGQWPEAVFWGWRPEGEIRWPFEAQDKQDRRSAKRDASSRCTLSGALIGCAGMPIRVREVRAAKPLPALCAATLPKNLAGYFPRRDALASPFLWLFLQLFHDDLPGTRPECPMTLMEMFQGVRSTTATLLTPLHARYKRPSEVAAMFRTVPPPEGMAARANSCVVGLN